MSNFGVVSITLRGKLTAKAPENGWLEYDCFLLGPGPIFRGYVCLLGVCCMAMLVSGRVILKPPTLSPFTADLAQWLMVDSWNILNAVESWVEYILWVWQIMVQQPESQPTSYRLMSVVKQNGVHTLELKSYSQTIPWKPSGGAFPWEFHMSLQITIICCTCLWPFISSSCREHPSTGQLLAVNKGSKPEAQNNWLIGVIVL